MTRRQWYLLSLVLFACLCPSPAGAADRAGPTSSDGIGSVEERRILASLEEQKKELAKQQEALRLRDLELQALGQEIDRKLGELKTMRDQLDKLLAAKDEEETRRIRDLSKMYERMEPAKAAELLAQLDRELAVNILGGIKSKVAGKLLNNMQPATAARFTRAYSTIARD